MTKYHNRRTISWNGLAFDSKKEASRYAELCLLEKAGKIRKLRRQVKYVLIPAQYEEYERVSEKTGKKLKNGHKLLERECAYIADFVYFDCALDCEIVEDTKGVRTEAYKIKRKLLLQKFGIRIKET